ncbi:MAG: hypothetical protein RRB13_00020 [bacterium]|nr:hypothetical protein [bacterium]
MRHHLEWIILNLLTAWVELLSPERAAACGRALGGWLWRRGLRRKVVDRNLELAFGDQMNAEELEALSLACYRNMTSHIFEFLKLASWPPELLDQLIELEGVEALQAGIDEGQGVVIAGAHFGHWELLSAGISHLVYPVAAYAGKQTNELVDHRINQIRTRFGMKAISKSPRSNREMLQIIKDQGVLGLLGDLNVPHQFLFVDFFGLKAAAGPGLGRFVVKAKCPLFYIWITREGPAKHKGHIRRLDYELTGDTVADTARIAQLYFDQLEEKIRLHPDHYFWFNRRFKTRPPEEAQQGVRLYEKMD